MSIIEVYQICGKCYQEKQIVKQLIQIDESSLKFHKHKSPDSTYADWSVICE